MTSRRIVSEGKDPLEGRDLVDTSPGSSERSNIAPAVSMLVLSCGSGRFVLTSFQVCNPQTARLHSSNDRRSYWCLFSKREHSFSR